MSSLRWAFSLGLLVSFATAQEIVPPAPSDAEFVRMAQRLEREQDKATRLEALQWINRRCWAKNAELVVPALERCIRDDTEMEVRRDAIQTLAQVVRSQGKPCPLVLVESLLDREDEVRWQVSAYLGIFKTYTPETIPILLRGVGSGDADTRSSCLIHLGVIGQKDAKLLPVFDAAKKDPVFDVRHSAYCAHFRATDKLEEFLPYIVRMREDPDQLFTPAAEDSETRKRERTYRNLVVLGSAMNLIEWSEKRPEELATVLLKLLEDPSPLMRQGAANIIGAAVRKVDLGEMKEGVLSKLVPVVDPSSADEKPKAKPLEERPEKSKVCLQLEKAKVQERLLKLREDDPDLGVREAARLALGRLASVQEKKP